MPADTTAPQRDTPKADSATASPRPRRHRALKRLGFGTLAVVLAAGLYTAAAAVAPLPAAHASGPATQRIVGRTVAPAWPGWPDAAAAVGAVGRPGLLAQTGSSASRPIASMTKTITALVVLQAHPLTLGDDGPTITFGQGDVDILAQVQAEDGSWAPVVAGEQLTERQALEAMLLPSANNYAISLANWSYGSVAAFTAAANSWLAAHGFSHSHMTDPSGLDPGTVSSARDLVGIGELVLRNPVLAQIVSTTSVTLPDVGALQNSNELLGTSGINGIKTGWTDQAGHCLLFAARSRVAGHDLEVVGVVMGAPSYDSLFASVPPLLASIQAGFHSVDLGAARLGGFTSAWGQEAALTLAAPARAVVFSDAPITVTVRPEAVSTGAPGREVGTVVFGTETGPITRGLTLSRRIADPGLWWRLTHPRELAW